LRDTIFIPDPEDKKRIISYLARLEIPMTWDECLRSKPKFIKKHCKHIVPPPKQLYGLVSNLFSTYGPLKDAQTGMPLFNSNAVQTAKNSLELVRKGYISDPPGVPLYYCNGMTKEGLPSYICCRGTNFTEGAVHRPIRKSMPFSGVSPRHTVNRLQDFKFKHNLQTGTRNMTGQRYEGHFDLWLINERQMLLNYSTIRQLIPEVVPLGGWVNGNLYLQTTEIFGILPVPPPVQTAIGMLVYTPDLPPVKHGYLAKKQNTRFAVLAVHTQAEKSLFHRFMTSDTTFKREGGPDFKVAVLKWNSEANGESIFYKVCVLPECDILFHLNLCKSQLPEQLKSYYSTWAVSLNAKHTRSATFLARKSIDVLIYHPNRSAKAPAVPQFNTAERPHPTAGFANTTHLENALDGLRLSQMRFGSTVQAPQSRSASNQPSGSQSQTGTVRTGSSEPELRQRAVRKCQKCGQSTAEGCMGSSGAKRCRNPCEDCGDIGCTGKNSRKKQKYCPNAGRLQANIMG
jgi:hypothetical protein